MRRRLTSLYIRSTTYIEVVTAWLLTVSAHGDHIGHPFI